MKPLSYSMAGMQLGPALDMLHVRLQCHSMIRGNTF